jgi:outer membrane protein assembly factor BamB
MAMMTPAIAAFLRAAHILLAAIVMNQVLLGASDWSQFGGDPQRTFLVHGERILKKNSVSNLKLHWKLQLDNATKELTSLTVPVVVTNVKGSSRAKSYAVVAGSDDNVFAINADTGVLLWRRHFNVTEKPKKDPDWLCPNAPTATPVVDRKKRIVYALSSDGQLHTLSLVTGEEIQAAREFTPPFAKTWSLNLVNGILYTPTSQACNTVRSAIYAMNADSGAPKQFLAMRTYGAGIWGRAGVAVSRSGTVFAGTGDGIFDPAKDQYPNTIVAVDGTTLQLKDYFTPSNHRWIAQKDLDMGNTSPVVFPYGRKELVAASGKEGVIWLLDTQAMGGADHSTPLYASELLANAGASYYGHGFWGALATREDKKHRRWLYAPAWGPPSQQTKFRITHGDAPSGSVMAFQVTGPDTKPVLTPAWRSIDMAVPEPVAIVNDVIFALSDGDNVNQNDAAGRLLTSGARSGSPNGHAILYALDAESGEVLYSSGTTIPGFAHFGGVAVADGQVFVGTWDNVVYAFSTR